MCRNVYRNSYLAAGQSTAYFWPAVCSLTLEVYNKDTDCVTLEAAHLSTVLLDALFLCLVHSPTTIHFHVNTAQKRSKQHFLKKQYYIHKCSQIQ